MYKYVIVKIDSKGEISYFGGTKDGVDKFYQPQCICGPVKEYSTLKGVYKKIDDLVNRNINAIAVNVTDENRYHKQPVEVTFDTHYMGGVIIKPVSSLVQAVRYVVGNNIEDYSVTWFTR
jgi:hypothetical protein